MTNWVAVLPYVYQPYFDACRATMAAEFADKTLFVDNTVNNLGCMKSHNLGVDRMYSEGADWLIIISPAIRFGQSGGMDFVDLLEEHSDHYIIHAATPNVVGGKQQTEISGGVNGVFGWHLSAFHRNVIDSIGRWDENFSPYGCDDIDLSLRIQKFFKGAPGWDTFPCDVSDTTMAHSLNFAGIKSPYPPRADYFTRKWGRTPDAWQDMGYEHPFNNPELALSYWPQPEDVLSIQNNEFTRYIDHG